MKTISSLIIACALATSVSAGVTYSSKSVAPVTAPAPIGCDCFAPGAAFGLNASAIFVDGGDEDFGGGVLAEYFFTDMIGIQGAYNLLATDSEHHEYDAALIVRFPIEEACIAPYIMGGVGYAANDYEAWNLFAGAGIDIRFPDANCFGIFADGAYHWSENDDADFTLVRLGVKFRL